MTFSQVLEPSDATSRGDDFDVRDVADDFEVHRVEPEHPFSKTALVACLIGFYRSNPGEDPYRHLLREPKLKERAAARLDEILTGGQRKPRPKNLGENDEVMVTITFASWNPIALWLRQLDNPRLAV